MHKFVTISLILMLFFNQVGYYFIYTLRQYQIKEQVEKQMLAGLPESSLEVIVADEKNDIIWEEEGKEFSLKGQLYDVAKIKEVNGKIFIYCLNDSKEEQLLQDLAKASSSDNSTNKEKGNKHIAKLQLSDFVTDCIEKTTYTNVRQERTYPDFKAETCSPVKKVTSPPPRLQHI